MFKPKRTVAVPRHQDSYESRRPVEDAPVVAALRPGTRFVSLSVLAPEFEMWNQVEVAGAINMGRAYSVKRRRCRLALEYKILGRLLPEPLPEHAQEFHSPAASRALEAKMAVLSEEMNSRGAAHQRQLQALLEETTRLQEQIQAPASASPGLQGTPQRSHRLSGTPEASGSRKRAPKTPSRRDLVLTDSWESREATRKMMYSDLYAEDIAVNMQRRTTPKKPQADCQREQTVSTFRRSLAESEENDSSPRQHMQCSREWWHQQRQMLIQDIERQIAETDFL
ncbi:hypothetical protein AK812_SmicGene22542 [Symbiodinium microadriaticum]|uniref:Uncharacterized protein n=1 Tax=Symbiodinium microadriaticum TaxID=2951 RepID=A0A1Q9DJJ0_SYMMI|nr:hypothetical protein AK812_SmicGene22542 [Symbiodinium microadriaticum]